MLTTTFEKENIERKLEMTINQYAIDGRTCGEAKNHKKRLAHYEGEVKVMDEIHQQAQYRKQKLRRKRRNEMMQWIQRIHRF